MAEEDKKLINKVDHKNLIKLVKCGLDAVKLCSKSF